MGGLCFARHLLQHPLYNPQLRNARWNLIADIKDDWIILTAYQYHEWVDNMVSICVPSLYQLMHQLINASSPTDKNTHAHSAQ